MTTLEKTLALAATVALLGCQGGPDAPSCGGELICTSARVSVPQPDGATDEVYVYGVAPATGGDLGVVIYGHGQGLGGVSNCEPDADSYSHPTARVLAAQGFAVGAIHYRNAGDGAPGLGTIRMRDHYVRDARGAGRRAPGERAEPRAELRPHGLRGPVSAGVRPRPHHGRARGGVRRALTARRTSSKNPGEAPAERLASRA